jgi:hypothetical protein
MNYSISLVRSSTKFTVILTPRFSDVVVMALGLKSRVTQKKVGIIHKILQISNCTCF